MREGGMRKILFIFNILAATSTFAFPLKAGDILLQSNACYLCSMIEAEEHSPYSHLGVLVNEHGTYQVLEAWGKVRKTSLNEFLQRRRLDSKVLVLRSKIMSRIPSATMLNHFELMFQGKSYDSNFLWSNFDANGEKYYCSEFVAKFMNEFLIDKIGTKPMHFDVNREFWIKYFHGNPPDGTPGLSPGDFERSPMFQHVGFI